MNCQEASKLISQGADRRLSFRQRLQLRLHLAICDACTNFSRQVDYLRRAIRRIV